MRVNAVAGRMPRSGIREIMDAAWGRPDVIRLEVGQPDFATPAHVVAAAHEAPLAGHTGYTPTAGIPQLRAALAEKVRERNGFSSHRIRSCSATAAGSHCTPPWSCSPSRETASCSPTRPGPTSR